MQRVEFMPLPKADEGQQVELCDQIGPDQQGSRCRDYDLLIDRVAAEAGCVAAAPRENGTRRILFDSASRAVTTALQLQIRAAELWEEVAQRPRAVIASRGGLVG